MALTSVLIPVFNNLAMLEQVVATLIQHADAPMEIILVDNASFEPGVDEAYARLAQQPQVSIIRNAENRGFGKANNQALAVARGDYIALINSDMFMTGPWMRAAQARFASNPNIGAVQLRIILPSTDQPMEQWQTQTCGARFLPDGMPVYLLPNLPMNDPRVLEAFPLQAFMGAGVILKREVINQVGFFDEEYDLVFFEDTDLSLRVSEAGHDIFYEPQAFVIHLHSASMPHLTQETYDRSRKNNQKLFVKKWPIHKIHGILVARGFPDPRSES
ncbi:glycosyltransferase family 2 protein [Magnetofaba australis]|nr:glycosyltransferase family 2 protein [Magnetofaba australis]